jgi:hypothetical protein
MKYNLFEKFIIWVLTIPLWILLQVLKIVSGAFLFLKAIVHDLFGNTPAAMWTYGECLSTTKLFKRVCVARIKSLSVRLSSFDFDDQFFHKHYGLLVPVKRITEKEDRLYDGRFQPVLHELKKIGPVKCSAF